MISHSTLTKKGQTTIPGPVRKAMGLRPGDQLEYTVNGDVVTLRVHGGTSALKGALASEKGKGLSFDEIRKAAARRRAREQRP